MICEYVDGNISTWGNCLIDGYFFSNPLIYIFVAFVFFIIVSYRLKIPGAMSIPLGIILVFAMGLGFGGLTTSILLLSMLLAAGYVAYILITKIMRQ